MNAYFITATGTEIGKTLVTCTLAAQLRQRGDAVRAIKPVVSGYPDPDGMGDPELLLRAQGVEITPETIAAISPWRFKAALSPELAAREEDKKVAFEEVEAFCRNAMVEENGYLLIEGAGGVLSPLTENHTHRDLIQALGIPAILVIGSYLGTITHTLTALEALAVKNISVQGLVVNASDGDAEAMEQTLDMLQRFAPPEIPVRIIPRLDFAEEIWEHVPDITSLTG